MNTELTTTITVKELCEGALYYNADNMPTMAMNGKLIVQPEYQRNYIYGDGVKDVAVVQSVLANLPLGILYFYKVDDNIIEVLDGQQRITSLIRFLQNSFSVEIDGKPKYYSSLPPDIRDRIDNYSLWVCYCTGEKSEIMDWFKTINIAGVPLNDQEILNAVYAGPFINSLRREFSNTDSACVTELYQRFIPGNPKRQDILAVALKWYSEFFSDTYTSVQDLLAQHQDNSIADLVKSHMVSLTEWAKTIFKKYDPLMKGVDWGRLFKLYCLTRYDSDEMYADLQRLKEDPAVTKQSGIFEYLLSGKTDPRLLNIRLFDEPTRRSAYNTQTAAAREANASNCPLCAQSNDEHRRVKIYEYKDMEADHIEAWRNGGTTTADNCQMLCKTCNRTKSYH